MRLEKVQDALRAKKIKYEYTEEDGCGSLDFMFRGLKFHVPAPHDAVCGFLRREEARISRETMKLRYLQRFFPGRI